MGKFGVEARAWEYAKVASGMGCDEECAGCWKWRTDTVCRQRDIYEAYVSGYLLGRGR